MRRVLILLWLVLASTTLAWGWDYYGTAVEERPFTEMHELLSPTGVVGQGYGIIGTLMIVVGVAMYSTRKRWGVLQRLGKLRAWLDVHIFLCTLGPFLVLLHTTFKFGGIVSVAFWAMAVVVVSGIFGRYVYAHLPKTLNGIFLSRDVVEERRLALEDRIRGMAESIPELAGLTSAVSVADAPRGFLPALALALRYDLKGRSNASRIRRSLPSAGLDTVTRTTVIDLVQRRRKLEQQILLMAPFRRLFHYWHVFHIPLAIVMSLILVVHVTVAILFGYTWIFSG